MKIQKIKHTLLSSWTVLNRTLSGSLDVIKLAVSRHLLLIYLIHLFTIHNLVFRRLWILYFFVGILTFYWLKRWERSHVLSHHTYDINFLIYKMQQFVFHVSWMCPKLPQNMPWIFTCTCQLVRHCAPLGTSLGSQKHYIPVTCERPLDTNPSCLAFVSSEAWCGSFTALFLLQLGTPQRCSHIHHAPQFNLGGSSQGTSRLSFQPQQTLPVEEVRGPCGLTS